MLGRKCEAQKHVRAAHNSATRPVLSYTSLMDSSTAFRDLKPDTTLGVVTATGAHQVQNNYVDQGLQLAPRSWKAALYAFFAGFKVRITSRDTFAAALATAKFTSEGRLRARHQETDLCDPCQSSKEPRLSTPRYPGPPECPRSHIWQSLLRQSLFTSISSFTVFSL